MGVRRDIITSYLCLWCTVIKLKLYFSIINLVVNRLFNREYIQKTTDLLSVQKSRASSPYIFISPLAICKHVIIRRCNVISMTLHYSIYMFKQNRKRYKFEVVSLSGATDKVFLKQCFIMVKYPHYCLAPVSLGQEKIKLHDLSST